MSKEKKLLKNVITRRREELNKLIVDKVENKDRILKLSQELDRLISHYYRIVNQQ